MKKEIAVSIAVLLLATGTAMATTYTEVGDAGQTLATSQTLSSGTNQILGSVSSGTADLYRFGWGGGSFYVNTVGTTAFDSQLFLFNSAGQGVQANDDGISWAGPAYLQLATLAAGTYYLGISGYDFDPRTATNALMFQSYPYGNLYGPVDASATLDHWNGGSEGGNYTINFRTTTANGEQGDDNPTTDPSAVPEPSTFALIGLGLAGLAFARRKNNK